MTHYRGGITINFTQINFGLLQHFSFLLVRHFIKGNVRHTDTWVSFEEQCGFALDVGTAASVLADDPDARDRLLQVVAQVNEAGVGWTRGVLLELLWSSPEAMRAPVTAVRAVERASRWARLTRGSPLRKYRDHRASSRICAVTARRTTRPSMASSSGR